MLTRIAAFWYWKYTGGVVIVGDEFAAAREEGFDAAVTLLLEAHNLRSLIPHPSAYSPTHFPPLCQANPIRVNPV